MTRHREQIHDEENHQRGDSRDRADEPHRHAAAARGAPSAAGVLRWGTQMHIPASAWAGPVDRTAGGCRSERRPRARTSAGAPRRRRGGLRLIGDARGSGRGGTATDAFIVGTCARVESSSSAGGAGAPAAGRMGTGAARVARGDRSLHFHLRLVVVVVVLLLRRSRRHDGRTVVLHRVEVCERQLVAWRRRGLLRSHGAARRVRRSAGRGGDRRARGDGATSTR